MNYDIEVCQSSKPQKYTSVEKNGDLVTYKLFFNDLTELKMARKFVIDCIVEGFSPQEIFNIAKKKDFLKDIENTKKVIKEKPAYKMRKIFSEYHFSYTK